MNKLVLFKNRFYCNTCGKLFSIQGEKVYCVLQDQVSICARCYKKSYKNRDDILVISD